MAIEKDLTEAALILVGGLGGVVVLKVAVDMLKDPAAAMAEARAGMLRRRQQRADYRKIHAYTNGSVQPK